MTIGPPERLPVQGVPYAQLASSQDGKVFASAQRWGAVVWDHDAPQSLRKLGPHEDARYLAVSSDGRWVATGSHNGSGARIWDAKSGKLLKELLRQESLIHHLAFSPDGKWLAIGAHGLRLWSVDSWTEGPLLYGESCAYAFAPNGKWLAHETGSGAIRLVDLQTGKELARLEDPDQRVTGELALSPDGSRIVTAYGTNQSGFHVWDLRKIRAALKRLGLDSDMLPSSPRESAPSDVSPISLEVLSAQAAPPLSRAEQAQAYLARYRRALQANPENAMLYNGLAWTHVMAPAEVRDTKEMLSAAEKAVRIEPGNSQNLNTLGAAYYRAGQYQKAIAILEKNSRLSADATLPFDLYFLAMSWQAAGEPAKARLYYDWAERWTRKLQGTAILDQAQLRPLRSEAAATLGIDDSSAQ